MSATERAIRWPAIAAVAGVAALGAAGWWRTFEWGSRERLRYSWALQASLAGRYAWGRPADEQPPADPARLQVDLASAAWDVSPFELAVIGFKAQRNRKAARP